MKVVIKQLGRVATNGVKLTQVTAKFEFSYESLKRKVSYIPFVNNLMTGCSKRNRENYPRKCFETNEKETKIFVQEKIV